MSVEVGIDEIVVDVTVPTIDVDVAVNNPTVDVSSPEAPPVEIGIDESVVTVSVTNPSVTVDVVDTVVEVILSGPPGKEGTIILNGVGEPSPDLGNDGYYYLDTETDILYGPKAGTDWPIAMDPKTVTVYTHNQPVLAKVWVVNHALGKHPIVIVEDGAGSNIFGTVSYTNLDSLTITFSSSVTGHAHCT